jgi:hypothetical protein
MWDRISNSIYKLTATPSWFAVVILYYTVLLLTLVEQRYSSWTTNHRRTALIALQSLCHNSTRKRKQREKHGCLFEKEFEIVHDMEIEMRRNQALVTGISA